MNQDNKQALLQGQLWHEFCDQLKAAGDLVLADTAPDDDLTRAEGYRYLTRLLRLSLEKNIEFSDPHCPQFYSLSHETAKIGNDNPDNFYMNCAVDGALTYKIRGHRGTVDYLSIESKAGSFAGQGDMAPTGHLTLGDLHIEDDGYFELIVSVKPHSGNWLPMTPDSDNLLVRQTFRDRRLERKAEMQIECLDAAEAPLLSPAGFADALGRVVPFVAGTAGLFSDWMEGFSQHVNKLPANDQQQCLRAGGDPAIHYHNSYWRLSEDEALVIRFMPPAVCRTWNFQLSNYWMESLDYRYQRISVNRHTAHYEPDGSVVIVVAASVPGEQYPNWLTTAGHACGAMLLRYIEAETFPPVHTEVGPVEMLRQGSHAGSSSRQEHSHD